jgi:hypothetical protein
MVSRPESEARMEARSLSFVGALRDEDVDKMDVKAFRTKTALCASSGCP